MHLTYSRAALAVLAAVLFFLPGCHRTPKDPGPLYIMLMFNGGACEQNGSTDVIEVPPDRAVIYQTAAELTDFEVRFTACPFSSCPVSSPHGRSVNVGQPNPGSSRYHIQLCRNHDEPSVMQQCRRHGSTRETCSIAAWS